MMRPSVVQKREPKQTQLQSSSEKVTAATPKGGGPTAKPTLSNQRNPAPTNTKQVTGSSQQPRQGSSKQQPSTLQQAQTAT